MASISYATHQHGQAEHNRRYAPQQFASLYSNFELSLSTTQLYLPKGLARIQIEHRSGMANSKVETVEHAAMPWQHMATVLYAELALEQTLYQVLGAKHTDYCTKTKPFAGKVSNVGLKCQASASSIYNADGE